MTDTAQELNERQQKIMELLMQAGEVRVSSLREQFSVTEMTVRRDLEKLEQLGRVKRTFGGAILTTQDVNINERTALLAAEKQRIGRAAAESIRPGDSIFLDGGTTTQQIARHLPHGFNITVVTNALNVACEIQAKQIPLFVTGGMLLETTSSMIGPTCVDALSKMAFDKVFLGATGISTMHGFSNSNMYEAEVKRSVIARAGEVHIAADASKFDRKDLFSYAELGEVQRIWTDREPEDPLRDALREASVEVVVCD